MLPSSLPPSPMPITVPAGQIRARPPKPEKGNAGISSIISVSVLIMRVCLSRTDTHNRNDPEAQMDVAIYENTMTMLALGRKGASESCLRHLSDDMFTQVLDFAGVKKPSGSTVKLFASRRPTETNEIIPLVGYSTRPPRAKNPPTMNLADSTLFEAGAKISVRVDFNLTSLKLQLFICR